MDLVSVIIPVYNIEKYVEECVNSVLRQDHRDLEVILIDDGSTDNSGDICDRIAEKDMRIKVIHQKNSGLSFARNKGIKKSSGEYLFFLDGDDYIPLNAISTLLRLLKDNGCDITIGSMIRTHDRKCMTAEAVDTNTVIYNGKDAFIDMLYGTRFSTSACGKLFRKKLFDGVEFPYRKFAEDLYTIYKTVLASNKIAYTTFIAYYYYYREEGSLVVSKYSPKHIEALQAVEIITEAVNLNEKAIQKAVSNQYINLIYDIAARKPSMEEFKNARIKNPLKKCRKSVLLDKKSPKRLRLFALISYFGLGASIRAVGYYNWFKWKKQQ